MKRNFDIIVAIVGLIVATPVMFVIAILLKIDSPGDVLFSQNRLGKNGRLFKIHKFRKFPQDWGTKGSGVTTQNDVRMTSFGAFLERTKLDELPQLWNILVGEMSFVGPRPESTAYQDLFAGEFEKLLEFTPGIFGPNQIAYRNESEMYPQNRDPDEFYREVLFPAKAKADINYFSKPNLISDFWWMVKCTIGTIVGTFDWGRVFRRHAGVLFIDLLLFEVAWHVAYLIRFDQDTVTTMGYEAYFTGCWLVPLIIFPIMLAGGCYRNPVKYFGLRDALRLTLVGSIAWMLAAFVQFSFFQRGLSVGIVFVSCVLFLGLIFAPRLWRRENWLSANPIQYNKARKVLIYGAGQIGSALAKFLDQGFSNVVIVGYLDEDEELRGRYINGLKVLGSWRDREDVVMRFETSELWVSELSNDIDVSVMKNWAIDRGIKFKGIYKL